MCKLTLNKHGGTTQIQLMRTKSNENKSLPICEIPICCFLILFPSQLTKSRNEKMNSSSLEAWHQNKNSNLNLVKMFTWQPEIKLKLNIYMSHSSKKQSCFQQFFYMEVGEEKFSRVNLLHFFYWEGEGGKFCLSTRTVLNWFQGRGHGLHQSNNTSVKCTK
jgi:hypothetical protein